MGCVCAVQMSVVRASAAKFRWSGGQLSGCCWFCHRHRWFRWSGCRRPLRQLLGDQRPGRRRPGCRCPGCPRFGRKWSWRRRRRRQRAGRLWSGRWRTGGLSPCSCGPRGYVPRPCDPQGYPSCSYDPRGHLPRPCDPRGYLLPTCDHRGRLPQGAPLLGQAVHPCVYVHSPAVGGSMLIASCVCGTGGLHSCRAPSAVRASAARVSGCWVPVMRVMAFRMPRVSTVRARAVWPLLSRAYRRSGCGRCSRCRPGYRGPVCQWSGCRRFKYRWRWCQRPGWSRRGRQWSG